MRLFLSALGGLGMLAVVILLRRRQLRQQTPSLVQDLAAWNRSMPLPKPRQIFSGTQPVDRKALARALKGTKAKKEKVRELTLVPEQKRRIG